MARTSARQSQQVVPTLGGHFTSPKRKRASLRKREVFVDPFAKAKQEKLKKELESLKNLSGSRQDSDPFSSELSLPGTDISMYLSILSLDPKLLNPTVSEEVPPAHNICASEHEPEATGKPPSESKTSRRRTPTTATHRLYDSWLKLLPTLTDCLSGYLSNAMGCIPCHTDDIHVVCRDQQHEKKTLKVLCLYFSCNSSFLLILPVFLTFRTVPITINVTSCLCETTPQLLVRHGLFPTSPSQPRMAVSVELLEFYRCLFERSCDAINALSSAIQAFYNRRGFILVNPFVSNS